MYMDEALNLHVSVLVFGAAGIDYIAQVSSFPEADCKIRTQDAKVLVGGNAANTAAALGRLGVACRLLSKVGSDANSSFLLSSLSSTMGVVVDDIIAGGEEESEISRLEVTRFIEQSLPGQEFNHVHFDSRHTEAAVMLAEYITSSRAEGEITLSVDVEKARPHLLSLILLCDIVFTNKAGIRDIFPSFTGSTDDDYLRQATSFMNGKRCDDLSTDRPSRCRMVVVTDGSNGSVVLVPRDREGVPSLASVPSLRFHNIGIPFGKQHSYRDFSDKSRCDMWDTSNLKDCLAVIAKDVLSVSYDMLDCSTCGVNPRSVVVIRCGSFSVATSDMMDTTGAGDAFIGGFIFGLLQRCMSLQECMLLGTTVATEKLYALGAQTNLPSLQRVVDAVTSRAAGSYSIHLRKSTGSGKHIY